MAYNIYHNFQINASMQAVFNAVTQPEHLNNWWSLTSSGTPALNQIYNLNFTNSYNWFGKVCKVETNKSFYLKMTESDADWNPTTFGFDLFSTKLGTEVHFSHVNWPEENNHFKHSSFCWALLLNGLKNYLEKGIIIPFEERA
ncbi:hypothetical protein PK35_06930 [Tamlana nanhaiensis]|uniref:Activator of Hsp90 ATPase homologue 1/2-like C-terminal domain-containing protein n=1 Tax=Neotamlana nanhaiensis TaxID=1382798 RepID=A0A0D7W361_9FLAO|nr:SRPBCC domain-containing protein [Tamlana nanhaiensis]KJD33570.1 hypothetical protein PK35_06930 [Tamlana nanhaiensis]